MRNFATYNDRGVQTGSVEGINTNISGTPYRVKQGDSPAIKLVKAIHPWLCRTDMSPSLAASMLARMSVEAQVKLAAMVESLLVNWAAEYENFPSGHPLSRVYRKAYDATHGMMNSADKRDARPRIPDERDADTAYWRELAQSTKR